MGRVKAIPTRMALEKLELFKNCCSSLKFSVTKSDTVLKAEAFNFKDKVYKKTHFILKCKKNAFDVRIVNLASFNETQYLKRQNHNLIGLTCFISSHQFILNYCYRLKCETFIKG